MAANLVIKAKCAGANKTAGGAIIQFAKDAVPGDKPGTQVARTGVSVVLPDAEAANNFKIGADYTITISDK